MLILLFSYLLVGSAFAEPTCYPPCKYNEECNLIGRGQIPTCVPTPPSTTTFYTQDCEPPFPTCDFGLSCRRKSDGTQDCYPYCIPSCGLHQYCFWSGPGTLPECRTLDPPACTLPCPLGQTCQLDDNWNQYCAVTPTTPPPCVLPCPLGYTCQLDMYGKPFCAAPPCGSYSTPSPTTPRPPVCKPPCKKGFHCQLDNGQPRCFPNSCPKNEVVNPCGSRCENTCAKICKPQGCPKICDPPACVCASDYYRDASGTCVKENKCPKCPTTAKPPKYP